MKRIFNILNKIKKDRNLQIITASLLLLIMVMSVAATSSNAYEVVIDGEKIGCVDKKEVCDEIIAELEKEQVQELKQEIKGIANSLEFNAVKSDSKSKLTEPELKEVLQERIDWKIDAVALKVNDETEFFLKNESEAEEVLDLIKEKYTPEVEDAEKVEVDFEEEVAVVKCETEKSKLLDASKAVEAICLGKEKPEIYEVEDGDNLWDIAHANNLTVGELEKANPGINLEKLKIGQELNLVKIEPLLSVVTKYIITEEEEIKCETKYIDCADLPRGKTKIKEKGENGKKEITYQIVSKNGAKIEKVVVEEKSISDPKEKVIQKGTGSYMVASRSGGSSVGSGSLQWPVQGRISSPYGKRGSGFHSGIDISAPSGRSIVAADGGRVTAAGWSGAYGNCIDIDHGNGKSTRYAHLSKISVGVGQNVNKGQTVGLVGSTGRSTGPHLHFEVRVNGSARNPMGYL